jgi:hypothetical protein
MCRDFELIVGRYGVGVGWCAIFSLQGFCGSCLLWHNDEAACQ